MLQPHRVLPDVSSMKWVAWACAGLMSLGSSVHAQDAPPADAESTPGTRQTGLWVEPRVSMGMTLSSNGGLDATNTQSEQILEIGPGIRAVANLPRLRGFLDYSLTGLYHAQSTTSDRFRQALDAAGTFEAVDNRVFVDMAGVVAEESVSAFGTQSGVPRVAANRSETSSFRVSPYVRGDLAGWADYELRYAFESLSTDSINRSDVTIHDYLMRLRNQDTGARLGWALDASSQEVDYSLGRTTRADNLRAALLFSLTPQLRLGLLKGVEANNVITFDRETYDTYGFNVDWRPTDRSRWFVEAEHRYFGTGHTVAFDYRARRTVWRYTNTRGVVNSAQTATSASLGSIYDLLDSQFQGQGVADPVVRAQMVDAELRRLGLPADAEVFDDFLRSSAALERGQGFSVAFVGVRSVVTLALARGDSQRLGPLVALGDDFDVDPLIRQQSWSINYAHRLTPITSLAATFAQRKNIGVASGRENNLKTLALGATTQLGLRTSGSLQLLRSYYESRFGRYNETAISGVITHRF